MFFSYRQLPYLGVLSLFTENNQFAWHIQFNVENSITIPMWVAVVAWLKYVEAQCCGLVEPESPLLAGAVAVKKGAALARTCVERKETYKILNIMSNKFIFPLRYLYWNLEEQSKWSEVKYKKKTHFLIEN